MVTFADIIEVAGGYRCPCGLIWTKDYQAIGCENHGHVESYTIRSAPAGPPSSMADYETEQREVRALRREPSSA
jgi:hypothetical protein